MLCITYIESLSNQTVLRRLYFVFGIWMIFWIWIVLWSYVRFWHASSIVQKSYLLNLAAQEYYAFGVLMREKSGLIFWPRYFFYFLVWSAKVLMQWDKYNLRNEGNTLCTTYNAVKVEMTWQQSCERGISRVTDTDIRNRRPAREYNLLI